MIAYRKCSLLAGLCAAALVVAGAEPREARAAERTVNPAAAAAASAGDDDAVARAVALVARAVVRVEAREPSEASDSTPTMAPWRDDGIPELPAGLARLLPGEVETASGVVISPDGYIVTAGSLFRDSTRRTRVIFPDGKKLDAVLIGRDVTIDIALLKVGARNLAFLELADSDTLRPGELVLALGDPFGVALDGQPAVSAGIVAAIRPVRCEENGYAGDMIETDAAINPGVHGGALADLDGRLVGICAPLLRSRSTDCLTPCAVPANAIKARLPRLRLDGRPYLGVLLKEEIATATAIQGVLLDGVVPGSPAASADLRSGDRILAFGPLSIDGARTLVGAIEAARAGDTISVRVDRNGRVFVVDVVLARRDF